MAHLSKSAFFLCRTLVGEMKKFEIFWPKNKCAKWCGMKNSRFLNRFFSANWCGMKNSRFLNHFFFFKMMWHEKLTFFEPFFFLRNGAARKTHVFWTVFILCKMPLREKLTFFEPFRPLFGSSFVVERSVRKTCSFCNRSESCGTKNVRFWNHSVQPYNSAKSCGTGNVRSRNHFPAEVRKT